MFGVFWIKLSLLPSSWLGVMTSSVEIWNKIFHRHNGRFYGPCLLESLVFHDQFANFLVPCLGFSWVSLVFHLSLVFFTRVAVLIYWGGFAKQTQALTTAGKSGIRETHRCRFTLRLRASLSHRCICTRNMSLAVTDSITKCSEIAVLACIKSCLVTTDLLQIVQMGRTHK